MKFKLSMLIDLVPGSKGLMIPVFKIEGSNLPFVQEMNEAFEVVEMQPYLAADFYEIALTSAQLSTDVGEKGIIAFRSFDDEIFSGDISQVLTYRDINRAHIADVPMLDLQIGRICGDPINSMYDKWRSVSDIHFEDKDAIFWRDNEISLYQQNRVIWTNLDHEEKDQIGETAGLLSSHSFEYMFRWLTKNFVNPAWKSVWIKCFRISPFDERLYIIAEDWLRLKMSDYESISEIKLILFVLLENQEIYRVSNDFIDQLNEYIYTKNFEFYEMLSPDPLAGLIFERLERSGEPKLFEEIYRYLCLKM
jgi:hypothetical protein